MKPKESVDPGCDAAVVEHIDLYRDTPIRLLGYANEVGESFRAIVNVNWVRLSYAMASGYCIADTLDKSYKKSKLPFDDEESKRRQIMLTAVDTLIWQSLASVMIPGYILNVIDSCKLSWNHGLGFTINRICALSMFLMARYTQIKREKAKWSTVFVGLGSIPFIVKPIDHFVDNLMDSSIRKYF